MTYLFKKYPHANSGQLSSLRSRVVCGPVLAFIAVKVLNLHGYLLAGNLELIAAVDKYIPILQAISSRDIVLHSWAHDPPKVISDIFESLVAAILIDSGYNFDKTMGIVEAVMGCVLEILSPDMPPEPVSALFLWVAKSGCKRIHFRCVLSEVLRFRHFYTDSVNRAVAKSINKTIPFVLSYMTSLSLVL
jgi:endoribonuclease Dicer